MTLYHLPFYFFAACECYVNGTKAGSNECEKSYHSNGSCLKQPGCKHGYKGDDCGTCDSESGYGEDKDGNCNNCIDTFFIKRHDSEGRPECQGMSINIDNFSTFFRKKYIYLPFETSIIPR